MGIIEIGKIMPIQVRLSGDRGYFDHGWLKTYHTFSFAQYQDPTHKGFRALRVINEDRVRPGVGFPSHSHQDMEIFSLVIEGGLSYQDDLGNGSILRRGQIQLMSAGKGLTHAELNASDQEEVHFLQLWIVPNARHLKPSYQEKFFEPSSWHHQWRLILSGDGREGSLHIHQDANVYLASLDEGQELNYELGSQRFAWVQIIKGSIDLNGVSLRAGDGAAISDMAALHFKAQESAELLLIDLA